MAGNREVPLFENEEGAQREGCRRKLGRRIENEEDVYGPPGTYHKYVSVKINSRYVLSVYHALKLIKTFTLISSNTNR